MKQYRNKTTNEIKVGDKIKFKSEKQRYTVRAISRKFAICTKPFNARKTYLYSIIDFKNKLRGRDNYGCYGYETDEQCQEPIKKWDKGEIEHSSRMRPIELDIELIS